YQVIGSLASDLGVFGHTKVVKALDNASEHAMVHDDVLPFPSFSKPTLNDARKIMKKHRDTLKALTAHKEIPSDDQLIALALEVAPDATDEQVKLYGHLWVKLCRLALARYSYGAIVQKADDDTYTDENGTVWTRPTAWAYAQVCKARDKWQAKAEQKADDAKLPAKMPEYEAVGGEYP